MSLAMCRHLVAVCDRFEAARLDGSRPRIDDFLADTPEPLRAVLRDALAALERGYAARDETFPATQPGCLPETVFQSPQRPDHGPLPRPGVPPSDAEEYEVLELLGRGGMGVVYKARQVALDRTVALKMILGQRDDDAGHLARFRAEAQAVARLSHPNVVQIFEIGTRDGQPFFSMEFVDGGSLARKLEGGPLPVRQAAQLAQTLARAIHAAHLRGIVHQDLKPANVVMTVCGQPKITDFGLARVFGGDPGGGGGAVAGGVQGTPSYMAPEQAEGRGEAIGPATDVYALGSTLYEMLAGRPPFRGRSVPATLEQVRTAPPIPPGRLRPKLPRDLETICLTCLEKEPGRRYADAEALADDLHAFLGGEPIRGRPATDRGRFLRRARRGLAVLGAGAAAGGLAAGVWWHNTPAFAVVAALGLAAGGSWYHARLRTALKEVARQQVAAERHTERLRLLGEMTRRVMGETDLDRLFFLLGETATRLLNAELATLYLVDRDRGEVWSKLTLDNRVGEIRIPLGVGIAGQVASTVKMVNLPDAYADPRFNPEIDRRTGHRTRTMLTIPMTDAAGVVVEVFQVLNKRAGPFEVEDEEVLAELAASAAVAVGRAQARAGGA